METSAKLKAVLLGFHHVTAFAGGAQANLDFYRQRLGLRLVKKTVNYDDPATYHFYYGDELGSPGSLLTFFPWPTAPAGAEGSGQAIEIRFALPHPDRGANDPSGLRLQLADAPAPKIESVTLRVADAEPTARFLTEMLGFRDAGDGRFELGGGIIQLVEAPGMPRAKLSSGMIHHIALRVADDTAQDEWRAKLKGSGVRVTRVIDRQYFRSIYFREPGGVLFEIATDGPGFLIDEPADALGSALKLPPWLEPVRESVERRLAGLE
jgi:glyoxalase family protein